MPTRKKDKTKDSRIHSCNNSHALQFTNDMIINNSIKKDSVTVKITIRSDENICNKPNIICMNPSLIMATSFNFFGYIVASYQKRNLVCLLYPDQSVDADKILISKFVSDNLKVEENKTIVLSHLKQKILKATEIILQYDSFSIKKDDPTFEYAIYQLEGMVLKKNDKISFTFHNLPITFTVVNIAGSNNYDILNSTIGAITSKENIDEPDITSLLEGLSLFNDNTLQSLYDDSGENKCDSTNIENYGYVIRKNFTKINFVSMKNSLRLSENLYDNGTGMERTATKIFGFEKVLNHLYNSVILPVKYMSKVKSCGLITPHGIIIHGQHGSGKTSIVQKLLENDNVKSIWIDFSEINRDFEDPKTYITNLFNKLFLTTEPTFIVVENCDYYFPKEGKEFMNEEIMELCSIFLFNAIKLHKAAVLTNELPVYFIGICCDILKMCPSLYQNGIFDIEYEIPIPNNDDRFKIIEGFLSQMDHNIDTIQIKYLANHLHGYLPSDLVRLTQLSSVHTLERHHFNSENSELSVKIELGDFKRSMNEISPSVIRAFTTDIPKIRWDDIGGMDEVKNHLKECILWPIQYPDALSSMGIEAFGGVLLYGPPGCSKTMMARALAGESQMNFISIKGPELVNKYVGETEKAIRDLFKKARLAAPCILFFDEMDAIASQRDVSSNSHSDFKDRILAQFLTEIDGISGRNLNLFVVAATNRPFTIDSALMRPGRFDRLVYVPLPDSTSRKSIFNIQFKKIPLAADVDLNRLVELTQGYSGAEIVALCKEAAYCALRLDITMKFVSMKNFETALINVRPRLTPASLQMYINFKNKNCLD